MRYDAAVIGAGPAGAFSALRLSRLGHRTLIIDPLDKKKICAGILTARYAGKYGVNEAFLEREIKGVRISFHDIMAEITYRNAVEYSIDREAYDSFNLNLALSSGTDLKKDPVLSIEEQEDSLIILTKRERIVADYAIVASGVSEISRLCGGATKYAFCVQQKKEERPQDYFEMNLHSGGYSWKSPKKDNVLVGTSSLESYPDVPGEKALIPLEPAKKTFSGRFLIAGDAAGFVSPFEGEGIYYARRSGEMAAEVLSGAMSGENELADYEKLWKKEFDFSILKMLSGLLKSDRILEIFVRSLRDNGRFNKLIEDILTKEKKDERRKDISFLQKSLI